MNISPLNNTLVRPEFKGNEKKKTTAKKELPQNNDKKYTTTQVSGMVFATALSAAALGGAIMHGRANSKISSLMHSKNTAERLNNDLRRTVDDSMRQIRDLTGQVDILDGKNRTLTEAKNGLEKVNKALTEDNEGLKKSNKTLQDEIQRAKDKLNDIFEGDIAPKDVRERIYNQFKGKIESGKLGYDVSTTPVTGRTGAPVFSDAVPLPPAIKTSNRANMRELNIPEITENGSFDFKLPTSAEMQISRAESKNFKPVANQLTNITESYADSVKWDNDKIARDVLQNFFDGHGQTLDGVHINFTPTTGGNYKIRITGDSTYTADKAVFIGESTKRDNAKAAGNYGEGLKMSVLKLLRDKGAQDVRIGSDNWELTYSLQNTDLSDKRVMAYTLDKVDNIKGNYLEFETGDKDLLETFRKSINRFYHSNNPHFKCPDFENDIIGIKTLGPNEKGGIYIAGQRFEFNNDYDGLKNFVIFLKEKPPVNILDPSRDRTSLNNSNLEDIASWIARHNKISNTDKIKILNSLESKWEKTSYLSTTAMDKFIESFLRYTNWDSAGPQIHIKFPEKYIAYSNATPDVVNELTRNGYKVCKEGFAKLGMPTIRDLFGEAKAHDIVMPNEVQTKKIMILKEALKSLSNSLKGTHFTPEELDAKIYLFDNKSAKDSRLYKDALAEAITDHGTSKGFWLDMSYLNRASLSDVLETALHELSHKVGGDESATFSYKLTNVNRDAIAQILNDTKSRNELQALNKLWNELDS